ncbi:hypothetical protein SUGI_0686360 [Cryptomeria japonica]|nr:hypothetical protein SUGI_0686360 [Cryptomeria japonica]
MTRTKKLLGHYVGQEMIHRTLCGDKHSWQLKRLQSLLRPELEDERDVIERDAATGEDRETTLYPEVVKEFDVVSGDEESSFDTSLFFPISVSVFPLLADIKLASMDAFTKVVKFIKIASRSEHEVVFVAWLEENSRRRWQTKGGANHFICNEGALASSFDDRVPRSVMLVRTLERSEVCSKLRRARTRSPVCPRCAPRVHLHQGGHLGAHVSLSEEEVGFGGGCDGFGKCSNQKDGSSTLPNRKESATLDTDTSMLCSKIDSSVDDLVAKDIGANRNFSCKHRKTSPLESGGGGELVEMIAEKGVLESQFFRIVTKPNNFDVDMTTNVVTTQAVLSFEEAVNISVNLPDCQKQGQLTQLPGYWQEEMFEFWDRQSYVWLKAQVTSKAKCNEWQILHSSCYTPNSCNDVGNDN